MVKQTIILVLLFNFIIQPDTSARESNSSGKIQKEDTCRLVQDANHFYRIGLNLLTAPKTFKVNDWQQCGLIASSTAFLILIDKNLQGFAQDNQNQNNNWLFSIDRYHGNIYTAVLAGGTYGLGYLFKNAKICQMGLHSMEAFLYSGILTSTLQTIFGRRRPYGGENNLIFKPFTKKTIYNALPSGHTTVAFAVSTVMAKSLDNLVWKTFWYGNACLVGAARVYHNKHWLSDIFLGSVIGYIVANYIVNFERPKTQFQISRINPYINADGLGVRVYF